MTQIDSSSLSAQDRATGGLIRRIALPLAVFSGTMVFSVLAVEPDVCRTCTATPILDALPWGAAAALVVLAVQTLVLRMRQGA